ncbi:hypothetical protein [Scytonema sp. NUACC21]
MSFRRSSSPMPTDITGSFTLEPQPSPHGFLPVYISGRQVDDFKVWTSPVFIGFEI